MVQNSLNHHEQNNFLTGKTILLTQYAIYNIAKQVAKWIGIKLTKDAFAKGVAKVVPLIGAPISAGVTYWAFKPMANKLRKHLDEQLQLSVESIRN